ncbi:MAG: YcxB family protein [Lachnospiraceae bacterium]|nr:YcxB family protein [Lachnospiraceae bacterium]
MEEREEITDGQRPEAELEISVKMSAGLLYDYMLKHAYSSAAGILGTCFGAAGVLFFFADGNPLYLILGIVLIVFLPISLAGKSNSLMQLNPAFQDPLNYRFDSKGFTVSQGEEEGSVSWDGCTKAVSTKRSIIVYTGKNNASIFPRDQIEGGAEALMAVLGKYMDPKRIKIRY